jgi:hypothetical protein
MAPPRLDCKWAVMTRNAGQAFYFCPRKSRLICPTGCLVDFVSSAISKNISLHSLVETALLIPPSHPTEGRMAIVTDAGCGSTIGSLKIESIAKYERATLSAVIPRGV